MISPRETIENPECTGNSFRVLFHGILINTGQQSPFIRMFRTPIPNADRSRLENFGTDQLLGLFSSCTKTGSRVVDNSLLSDAWGTLFSRLYLSAGELVDEMQRGEHRLDDEQETMLREFIRADCSKGGLFVLNVIHKGGTIDRAALIMIADLDDFAGIEYNGSTATSPACRYLRQMGAAGAYPEGGPATAFLGV